MRPLPWLYPLVSRLAAAILLVAGTLKISESLRAWPGTVDWTTVLQSGFEVYFGIWLLIGLYPRWSRLLALACFFVFLQFALVAMLQGRPNCNCFGPVPARPWVPLAIDASLFLGLLLAVPSTEPTAQLWFQRIRSSSAMLAALVVVGLVIWQGLYRVRVPRFEPNLAGTDVPAAKVPELTEQIIAGLERNRASLPKIEYTTETDGNEMHSILPGGERYKKFADTTGNVSVRYRISARCLIRGESIRQDLKSTTETPEQTVETNTTAISFPGKSIQFLSDANGARAWLMTDRGNNAIIKDLRHAGFLRPPENSSSALLKSAKVLAAKSCTDRIGRDAIRLRLAIAYRPRITDDITADFVPSMNFLPSRVIYRYPTGAGYQTVMDIDYQPVNGRQAWFPLAVTTRGYQQSTAADPDADSYVESSALRVVSFDIDAPSQVNDFDFEFPAGTRIVGDLAPKNERLKAPIRASALMLDEPRKFPPVEEIAGSASGGKVPWLAVASVDLVLLAVCVAFRGQFRF
jgi:hypothetical protein